MKIKPLQTNRLIMTWLCLCHEDEATSKWKKLAYIICALTLSFAFFSMSVVSVTFVVKYFKVDLEEALYAVFQVSGYFAQIYTMISAFILRNEISGIFLKLYDIYDACKYGEEYGV